MSWQAQEAVNQQSQIKDLRLFKFLLYLASYATADGQIDPAPTQVSLAAHFKVSERTIRSWFNRVVAMGELEVVRLGRGPGHSSAYALCLPVFNSPAGEIPEVSPPVASGIHPLAEAIPEELPTILSGILERVARLEEENRQLRQEMEQYRKKAEVNAAFVSGIYRKDDPPQEGVKPEEIPEITGIAPRGSEPPILKRNNNINNNQAKPGGKAAHERPGKTQDVNLQLTWGLLLSACQEDKDKAALVWQLQTHFCDITKINRPSIDLERGRTQLEQDWWPVLLQAVEGTEGDLERAKKVVEIAVQELDAWNPSAVSSPRSLRNKIPAVLAAQLRPRPEATREETPPQTPKKSWLEALREAEQRAAVMYSEENVYEPVG
jgi:hypothetical protein